MRSSFTFPTPSAHCGVRWTPFRLSGKQKSMGAPAVAQGSTSRWCVLGVGRFRFKSLKNAIAAAAVATGRSTQRHDASSTLRIARELPFNHVQPGRNVKQELFPPGTAVFLTALYHMQLDVSCRIKVIFDANPNLFFHMALAYYDVGSAI